jgi:hypothetical protein
LHLLDEIIAGVYRDQPDDVRDDLRQLANDRMITEDLRSQRAQLVLGGLRLRDILIAERQSERQSMNGHKPLDVEAGYLDKLRIAALTTEQLKAIPKPPWIVEDILQADSLAEIYGKPGTYKSFISSAWSKHVATGVMWSNRTVTPSPVVYIIAEGAHGMGDRMDAWEAHHNVTQERHPVIWLPLAVALGNPAWGQAVGQYAAENQAGLVVFDTRARNTVGLEENSARDMGLVVAHLDEARAICKACLLLVHHSNAFGDKSRGSTAVEGAVDTELSVKEADGIVTLKLEKQKNAPDGTEWRFRPVPVAGSVVLDEVSSGPADEISPNGWQMLDTLRDIHVDEPVSFTRWFDAGEVTKATFARQLKVLVARGFVAKTGKAYSPQEGKDAGETNEPF